MKKSNRKLLYKKHKIKCQLKNLGFGKFCLSIINSLQIKLMKKVDSLGAELSSTNKFAFLI